MSEIAIPESRAYRHIKCGNETEVGGEPFKVVSNPMSDMERTQCASCGAMFPISEFEWSDTGEKISDYYARYTKNASSTQRFLCSRTFMVMIIVASVVLTEVGIYLLLGADNKLVLAFCLVGGLMIGALIGMAIFVSGFANPITRKVCGVHDTRVLK